MFYSVRCQCAITARYCFEHRISGQSDLQWPHTIQWETDGAFPKPDPVYTQTAIWFKLRQNVIHFCRAWGGGVKSADRWWLWGGVVFSNNWIGIPLTLFHSHLPTRMDCSQLTLRKSRRWRKNWVAFWPHFGPEQNCEKAGQYLSSNHVDRHTL